MHKTSLPQNPFDLLRQRGFLSCCLFRKEQFHLLLSGNTVLYDLYQMRATPDFLAASATASATAFPTLGSKAAGIM